MATTLDSQIAAASQRVANLRSEVRVEFASGQDEAKQKGLKGGAAANYARQRPAYKAAQAELAAATNERNALEAQRSSQTASTPYGTTVQRTTFDENGDAESIVTRTNVAGQPSSVSQTAADPTPATDTLPANQNTPRTAPQSSTANNLQFTDDEEFDPTIALFDAPPTPGTSDIDFLAQDDEFYEPVPTDDELASIQENMDFAAADAEFANLQTDVEWTEDFYLDNADDLDEIAAKYGVDPTSPQAKAIWEQEYGNDANLNLNSDPNSGAGYSPAPPSPPPPRSIKDARKPISATDWRFRVRLSPFADYLYNSPNAGILAPLKATDGVIFPYTPTITMTQTAKYTSYNPTHSNFRGHWYQGSEQGDIIVNATFTAQDTNEAQYMLAVLHFFRSASKMFYGQNDNRRGTPPPLLYMNGLGEYQFNEHPCLLSMVTYTLPDNVDYIKTSNTASATYSPQGRLAAGSGHESWSSKITRMITSGIEDYLTGAGPTIPNLGSFGGVTKITDGATYVPTQLQLQLNFLPVNTRYQVSREYSSQDFASGKLLKKGYW